MHACIVCKLVILGMATSKTDKEGKRLAERKVVASNVPNTAL